MTKQAAVFEKVTKAMAKSPGASITGLCKKMGVNASYYFAEKKKREGAQGGVKARKAAYQRLDAGPAVDGEKVIVIMGTPSQIRGILQ